MFGKFLTVKEGGPCSMKMIAVVRKANFTVEMIKKTADTRLSFNTSASGALDAFLVSIM